MEDSQQADEAMLQLTDRLRTLHEIGRAVSAALDLDALYHTIYEQISSVLHTPLFFIGVVQEDRRVIRLPYAREGSEILRNEVFPYGGNMITLAIECGTPLFFHTYEEYRKYAQAHGMAEMIVAMPSYRPAESYIYVPLNTGSRTIGALSVQSMQPHAYTQDDIQTLSVIASQAAVAIENARLYQQSQQALQQMAALLDVAQTVNASLDLPTVLEAILAGMAEVLPYSLASLWLPDASGKQLTVARRMGPRAGEANVPTAIPSGHGITGTVFARGESLLVPDVRTFPGYIGDTQSASKMGVPLKRGDLVVGVLDVERMAPPAFTYADLGVSTLFASQAAIALENARLFASQQHRVVELQTIQSIVQKLTPLHEVAEIAHLINRELGQLIDYHALRLWLLDPETGELVSLLPSEPARRVPMGDGLTGWIAAHGRSLLITNTLLDPRASQISGTPRREESLIGAPLIYEGRVQGVITLSALGASQFDEHALRLLEIIAAQAALACDRARLYGELVQDAITDELTGLYNRRYLAERFREERARAQRSRHPLAALMLDIDRFKSVNDRWGHDAGDVVLRELAALIRGVVRTEDLVARYGGEEFCVLLPEVPLDDAEQVAERLRGLIAGHRLPAEAGIDHITVSVGLALLEQAEQDEELFRRADQAMYAVKRQGGNAVVILHHGVLRAVARHSEEQVR